MAAADALRNHGGRALAALEAAHEDDPEPAAEHAAEAFTHLIRLRDELIACSRAGEGCGEGLSRINALVSVAFGVERPINGFHWERVGETRDALRELLDALT